MVEHRAPSGACRRAALLRHRGVPVLTPSGFSTAGGIVEDVQMQALRLWAGRAGC
jgi:hypothetical protein